MTVATADVYARIRSLIPAAAGPGTVEWPETALDHGIEMALLWHSRFVSRQCIGTDTGDGITFYFDLPSDFLRLRRVEYPYGGTPPTYLSANDYELYMGTAGEQIFFETAPGSASLFGLHYTGKWTLTTLNSDDKGPIASLACAYLCKRRAATLSDYTDPSIVADTVDYRGRARDWLSLEDHFIDMYSMAFGLSAKSVKEGAPAPAYGVGTVPFATRYGRWWWATE